MAPSEISEAPRWVSPRDLVLSMLVAAFLLSALGVLAELAGRAPAANAARPAAADSPSPAAVNLVALRP